MTFDPQKIWKDAINTIRLQVKEETYELWLKHAKFLSFENNIFKIAVPNRYFVSWLDERFKEGFEKILNELTGMDLKVEFVSLREEEQGEKEKIFDVEKSSVKTGFGIFNPKYSFENFVVGQSNYFAHAASVAVSNEPGRAYNPLFIYGGVGLGKTHLLHAIGMKTKTLHPNLLVLYITSEKFTNELVEALKNGEMSSFRSKYRTLDVLLIDDIQFIAGKEMIQQEFFHIFNSLYEARKQIVITSDKPPKDLSPLEERLRSRFQWGVVADIGPPDLETRVAILKKKTENENFTIPEEVIYYIASRIKDNVRTMEGALIGIAAYSSLTGEEVNIEFAKAYINTLIEEEEVKPVSIERIQEIVAKHYNISKKDIISKKREESVLFPRMLAMYLARNLTNLTLPEIGNKFGGRDPSVVLYACNKIQKQIKNDPFFSQLVNKIVKEIKEI